MARSKDYMSCPYCDFRTATYKGFLKDISYEQACDELEDHLNDCSEFNRLTDEQLEVDNVFHKLRASFSEEQVSALISYIEYMLNKAK